MKKRKQEDARDTARDLSQRAHRRLIGILGLLLPVLLYLIAGIRPTAGLRPWQFLSSISAYYYTGAVAIFIGVIFALSLFLFSYRGYQKHKADRVLGRIGGIAAFFVALCPTLAPMRVTEPAWWTPVLGWIHYASAAILFTTFILFSIWLFRKSDTEKGMKRPSDKRNRDKIYLLCGVVMIVCILWIASSIFTKAPIFWQEAVAVEAFAVSWLVKGEAHQPFVELWAHLRPKRAA